MVRNESASERNSMKIIRNISKKFQCTKTGFERCVMQITIAIKVKLIKQSKSENAGDTKQITDGTKQNKRRQMLPKLEFIFRKKFQCAKTGFERCAMQITIAIKVPYRQ
ncbi:hypothetical protein T06_6466 [Trichinella sp. T6]|nr:hypothetical protein T06_6466 [Trichinella sp. T6]